MPPKRPMREGKSSGVRQTPAVTRKRFADWVTIVGGSRVAAETLGISRSYVDMIKNGDRSPGLVTAHRISQHTDGLIPMEAWLGL